MEIIKIIVTSGDVPFNKIQMEHKINNEKSAMIDIFA